MWVNKEEKQPLAEPVYYDDDDDKQNANEDDEKKKVEVDITDAGPEAAAAAAEAEEVRNKIQIVDTLNTNAKKPLLTSAESRNVFVKASQQKEKATVAEFAKSSIAPKNFQTAASRE